MHPPSDSASLQLCVAVSVPRLQSIILLQEGADMVEGLRALTLYRHGAKSSLLRVPTMSSPSVSLSLRFSTCQMEPIRSTS